ncbi:Zinc-finger homeodomain protein 2 [Nymphaea thermarum]|nr:Zinc-finger homeodomain protein 2 [Nymphaea thermarum]
MDLSVVPYGQISPEEECGKAEQNGGLESPPPRPALPQQQQGLKGKVRYRECLKNHAASIGGHANDGCGEFMPDGEEGSIEALRCAACGCHRNFHRKEVPGRDWYADGVMGWDLGGSRKKVVALGPHLPALMPPLPTAAAAPAGATGPGADPLGGMATTTAATMMMMRASPEVGEQYYSAGRKRFRTKFTQEQKDKMLAFADKLGWRIQKHDDMELQRFCMEVGVKRHVLKVWMHNNKNTLGKKPEPLTHLRGGLAADGGGDQWMDIESMDAALSRRLNRDSVEGRVVSTVIY